MRLLNALAVLVLAGTLQAQNDWDYDGVPDSEDNCVTQFNPGQEDSDCDGAGDTHQKKAIGPMCGPEGTGA